VANNKIIDRIINQYNISGLEALTKTMPLADLQSLLIEIYNKRAKKITPKQLLEQYKKNRFVQPAKVDPRKILEFDALAYKLLTKEYQILKLSPVSPLGSASVITPISQNTVLTTIRNTEVCSDTTNVMALEAALQRKKSLTKDVWLCASHRLLRTQFFDDPSFTSHFQILSLCIAGRDTGSYEFELKAARELIEYYIKLINKYIGNKQKYKIKVKIFAHNEILTDKLSHLIKNDTNVIITAENNPQENWNYYSKLRFNIFLNTDEELFICDGGDTTWTQQLMNDKKERFMISGLGSERLIQGIKK